METPVSPPHYERKGHENDMIEYIDENLNEMASSSDIDHRLIRDISPDMPPMKNKGNLE